MRIAVDAMGGDHAPREIIRGAQQGLSFLEEGDELLLYGPPERLEPVCRELGIEDQRIRIEALHASDRDERVAGRGPASETRLEHPAYGRCRREGGG